MRKISILLSTVLAVTLLAGCGAKVEDQTTDPNINTPSAETPVVEHSGDTEEDIPEDTVVPEITNESGSLGMDDIREMYGENLEMIELNEKMIGMKAPDAKVLNLNGDVLQVSDFVGKPFIIEFVASWCPVCQSVKPNVEAYKELDDSVEIVTIAVHDTKEDLERFADGGVGYYLAEDSESLLKAYNLSFVPIFFFVDSDGVIQFVYSGEVTPESLTDFAKLSIQ